MNSSKADRVKANKNRTKTYKKLISAITSLSLAVASLSSVSISNVIAVDSGAGLVNTNLLELSEDDLIANTEELINALVLRDTNLLSECSYYMTSDAYYDLRTYMVDYASTGVLVNYVLDYIEPAGSTDNDTVLMANVETNYNGSVYYTLYELHINDVGQIYGTNIWVY